MSVQRAFDFCQRPARAKKPEHLFFALMPDEPSAILIADVAARFAGGEGIRVKPLIAMARLKETRDSVLYGAKLAGQAVAAAGLTLKFDTIGTVNAERRVLALTASDKTLPALQADLHAALLRNGLQAEAAEAFLPLAAGLPRLAPERLKPVRVRVTGLALLRGEATGDFEVLRRWPLNRPSRLSDGAATNRNLPGENRVG